MYPHNCLIAHMLFRHVFGDKTCILISSSLHYWKKEEAEAEAEEEEEQEQEEQEELSGSKCQQG